MVDIMKNVAENNGRAEEQKRAADFPPCIGKGQFMVEQYYVSKKYHEISLLAEETSKQIVKNEDEVL